MGEEINVSDLLSVDYVSRQDIKIVKIFLLLITWLCKRNKKNNLK